MLRLVVERYDNQAIASSLGISKRTVETHVAALLRKLAMPDRRTLISVSGADGFRTRLTAALRGLEVPAGVELHVAELVGRHLGADRAHFHLLDPATDSVVVRQGWSSHQPSVAGRHRLSDFCDAAVRRSLDLGRTLVVRDAHRELSTTAVAAWDRLSVRAALTVLDSSDGGAVAALTVTSATPRDWGAGDAAVLEETAERTWSHVERWRLREALRAERRRFEALAESASSLVCRTDVRGCIEYANPAFRSATGLTDGDRATRSRLPPALRLFPEIGPAGRVDGFVVMADSPRSADCGRGLDR